MGLPRERRQKVVDLHAGFAVIPSVEDNRCVCEGSNQHWENELEVRDCDPISQAHEFQ